MDRQDMAGNSLIFNVLEGLASAEELRLSVEQEQAELAEEDREVPVEQFIVESLLSVTDYLLNEADLSLPNKDGEIPLHRFVTGSITERLEPIFMRVIQQSDVNAQRGDGMTPLMSMLMEHDEMEINRLTQEEKAQQLLDAGANPLLREDNGMTAADLAEDWNDDRHREIGRFLRQKEQEFRQQAQGALVQRTRGRQGANRLPLSVGRRITEFLGGKGRKSKKSRRDGKGRRTKKSKRSNKKTHKRR